MSSIVPRWRCRRWSWPTARRKSASATPGRRPRQRVKDPAGHLLAPPLERSGARLIGAFERTGERGYYTVDVRGSHLGQPKAASLAFAVNLAPEESDFTMLDEKGLRELLPGAELTYVDASAEAQYEKGSLGKEHEVWPILIWGLFLLIAIEFMFATVSGKRADTDEQTSVRERILRMSPGSWVGRMTGAGRESSKTAEIERERTCLRSSSDDEVPANGRRTGRWTHCRCRSRPKQRPSSRAAIAMAIRCRRGPSRALGTLRLRGCRAPVVFSPDGKYVVAAGGEGDTQAIFWDIGTGRRVKTLTANGIIMQLVFSPDGKQLAAAAEFGDLSSLWDVATAKQRFTFPGFSVAFSADGKKLISTWGVLEKATVRLRQHRWQATVRVVPRSSSTGLFHPVGGRPVCRRPLQQRQSEHQRFRSAEKGRSKKAARQRRAEVIGGQRRANPQRRLQPRWTPPCHQRRARLVRVGLGIRQATVG